MSMNYKKEIQITISEDCNLNCIYCYEKSKSHNVINEKNAQELIRNELSSPGLKQAIIYFHGGEIALHFDVIKRICEWVWKQKFEPEIKFAASTNGTLIHEDIKKWLELHSTDFQIGLSLDGTKEMHDINRNNSFDKIDVQFFKSTWPNQPVKMTISPLTIDKTAEGIIYIISQGLYVSANLAYGCEWGQDKLKKAYAKELSKLADFFISNPEIELPKRPLCKNIELIGKYVLSHKPQKHVKWCGTGEFMVCYSPEGNKYPCQMFMPSSGNEKINIPPIENIQIISSCKSCCILSICPSCYGYNFINTGIISKAPDGLCDYTKLETLCYSYILSTMLKDANKYKHTRHMSDITKALCIKGIRYIQENLSAELSSYL